MNIAIVTNWFPAGAGYVSRLYRKTLENHGANVYIYARGGRQMRGDQFWDDERVVWGKEFNGIIDYVHLLSWLKRKKIDVVFFNEQRQWGVVIRLKEEGYKIGAYVDYYTQSSIAAFEIYDFLICNTKRHFSVFNWHKGARYIPWGTDTDMFKPVNKENNSTLSFIISAGWQLSKNADRRGSILALESFLKTKGQANLLFFSQVPLNEAPSYVSDMVRSDNRVKYITGTFEPFPYTMGDIYLYPSRLDGIGLTLPEAISSGLAVITTNSPPMSEFVIQGFNGFLLDVEKYLGRNDGYYWAESVVSKSELSSLIQFYIDNPKVAKAHKSNSRNLALSELDWYQNSLNILELFENSKNNQIAKISLATISHCVALDSQNYPTTLDLIVRIIVHLKNRVRGFLQFRN